MEAFVTDIRCPPNEIEQLRAELETLTAERGRYKAALQFYANEKHYDEDGAPGRAVFSNVPGEPTEYDFEPDLGHRACVALEPHPNAQQPTPQGETTAAGGKL